MSTFRFIRIGNDYDPVIAVSPENSTIKSEGTNFYRFSSWNIEDCPINEFHEISKATALSYFSGHADGLGFMSPPDTIFTSIQEMTEYVNEKRSNSYNEASLNHWASKLQQYDKCVVFAIGGRSFGFLPFDDTNGVPEVLQIEDLQLVKDSQIRMILGKFIIEVSFEKMEKICKLIDYIVQKNYIIEYSEVQELLRFL